MMPLIFSGAMLMVFSFNTGIYLTCMICEGHREAFVKLLVNVIFLIWSAFVFIPLLEEILS